MRYEDRVVCFLDILGFASHIRETILQDGSDDEDRIKNITDAFDIILDFYQHAQKMLRQADSRLYLPFDLGDAYDMAYFNKFKFKPTMDNYGRSILEGSGGKCTIVRSAIMGTGQRIILTVPGNFDFGMNTLGDEDFVQVRNPYEDPNEIQFWIQGDYGCRIRSYHEKAFLVNDGSPVANALSGDYVS